METNSRCTYPLHAPLRFGRVYHALAFVSADVTHFRRWAAGGPWQLNMKSAIKRAVLPAAVMAVLAATFFGTPDVITMAILTTAGFVFAMAVLLAFWRLTSVASWTRWKQRLAIWLVAACGAAAGCYVMVAPMILRR